ncbi:type II toxin-antitoxin system HipA family toxin [Aquisalimonas sp. APHAB1-3]|uniref:type II toxin-antitoxin system HipA family toxin n=1 Tax=Aquisalimonas sp. APHAB1-3 TaxID=3402080 RepID=UPI003AB03075
MSEADQLDVVLNAARVGTLRETRGRLGFAYSPEHLAQHDAFPIDPQLPLVDGMQYPRGRRQTFGVFEDMAPDRWGRTLIKRREALRARDEGRKPRRLSELDILASVQDETRQGALRLSDGHQFVANDPLPVPPITELRELASIAYAASDDSVDDLDALRRWLAVLVAPGASLGGARPKANFRADNGAYWIAKFPSKSDAADMGGWEYLAHELAVTAGITVPHATLQDVPGHRFRTFCVERFDRNAAERIPYASAMTLLERQDNDPEPASYAEIAQIIQTQGAPQRIESDLHELFRRAAFNVLISNTDDHLRNHGFLVTPNGLALAPAFDVNPNPDAPEHALALDEISTAPSLHALRQTSEYYALTARAADAIIDTVAETVSGWESRARALGFSRTDILTMETCFRLDLAQA